MFKRKYVDMGNWTYDGMRLWKVSLLWALACASALSGRVLCLNEEGQLLFNWKRDFLEDGDDSLANWNASDSTPCLWSGVECTQGSVSALDLSPLAFCNLAGDIHALTLGKFENLTTLNVGNTSLSGNFPEDVVKCSKLVYLNLSTTSIAGELPENLTLLQHLQVLDLTSSYFEGAVLTRFDEFPELRYLGLGDNYFESPVPESILNVKKLEGLTLSLNYWTGNLPLGFFAIPNLTQLWLGSLLEFPNMVPWPNVSIWEGMVDLRLVGVRFPQGPFPQALLNLTTLRCLHLERCNITGPIPHFGSLPLLDFINLSNNTLSGEIPDMFGSIPKMRRVWMFGNQLTGPIPQSLFQLRGVREMVFFINMLDGDLSGLENVRNTLQRVDFSYNNLTGEIPASLGNFPRLTFICLDYNSLTGQIPASLGNLRLLDTLRLSFNNLTGPIPASIGNLTNLSVLQMGFNNLTGPVPAEIANFERLTFVAFESNQLTGEIPYNLGRNAVLQWVDFGTNNLEGPVPPYLCSGNSLTFFMLSGNRLTGTIPETYGNCTNLEVVRLDNNQLEGPLPAGLWAGSSMWRMQLNGNNLSGTIDASIGNAKSLSVFLIQDNKFSGSIPDEIGQTALVKFRADSNAFNGTLTPLLGNLTSLTQLVLSANSFHGAIPGSLGNCTKLFQLDLSVNRLTGGIPDELTALNQLSTLDVSQNELTGPIPRALFSLDNLQILNVAFNNLSGVIPNLGNGPQFVSVNFTGNPYLCEEGSCGTNSSSSGVASKGSKKQARVAVFVGVFGAVAVVLLVLLVLVFRRSRKASPNSPTKGSEDDSSWTLTSFHNKVYYDDEVTALDEANLIGAGGSGKVYKVKLSDGEIVAVKKLWTVKKDEGNRDHGFGTELKTVANIRHRHIVRLLCSCTKGDNNLLVYEYMPKGSLGDLLHGPTADPLPWEMRFRIAKGAAAGLEYLHHDCSPQVLHRDIKPNNILVDMEYEARVADFGIAKAVDPAASLDFSSIAGSLGYIPPEYSFGTRVTEKIDIYSFGVVLLELVTGKRATEPLEGVDGENLVQWVHNRVVTLQGLSEILDSTCGKSFHNEMVQVLRVGMLCTNYMPADRPSMREVVKLLENVNSKELTIQCNKDGGCE